MVAPRANKTLLSDKPAKSLSTTVSLSEVLSAKVRLEASAFNAEARHAVAQIRNYPDGFLPLLGTSGLASTCSTPLRLRRVYVNPTHGVSFLSSSDIINLHPEPSNYISKKLTRAISKMLIERWDVLISRSGTIGNIGFAGSKLKGMALSEHALRLRASDASTAGFIAAFLRSRYGRLQLTRATYGSVVVHIEPEHLEGVIVPCLHPVQRSEIGNLFVDACESRDKASDLLEEADKFLHKILGLKPLSDLIPGAKRSLTSQAKASRLDGRLDAAYHDALAKTAEKALARISCGLLRLDDPSLSREVRAVTKFRKRVYVPKGIPLLSSKQIFQIDPIDIKELGRKRHSKDMPEIGLKENMVAITCSGTIGRVQIIPKYMEGWAANQHAIRILPSDPLTGGYLYAWLASDYGYKLISRHSYGSVILEIDRFMLASVPVPNASQALRKEVGELVLRAKDLRHKAWALEQAAIKQVETIILKDTAPKSDLARQKTSQSVRRESPSI
ncbi:MAG: hypothetical protein MN733_34225 [Nitrososphaera sp.]|nr:hypothetical protein [Nitrososphaera sp.]